MAVSRKRRHPLPSSASQLAHIKVSLTLTALEHICEETTIAILKLKDIFGCTVFHSQLGEYLQHFNGQICI